jgi:hypothetical protein
VALAAVYFDDGYDLWLAGACGIAAVLAIVAALILLPRTGNRVAMALLTAAGVVPVLCVSLAADRVVAALMAAALAAGFLATVSCVTGVVRQVWSALTAISALIAVTVAFDGHVAGLSYWRWRSSSRWRAVAMPSRDGRRSGSRSQGVGST